MAFPKEERNREFLQAWKAGANNGALGKRFGLTIGGVKALKARLKAKSREKTEPTSTSTATPKAPGKVAPERKEKVTSTSTQTSTSTSTKTKRMAFWLPESTIEEIKELAAKEKRTASAILRGILGKYLKNK